MMQELIFIVSINMLVLCGKLVVKIIDSMIIVRKNRLQIIIIFIDIMSILTFLLHNFDKFTISLFVPNSFYDIFFIFFCHTFYLTVLGILYFFLKKICEFSNSGGNEKLSVLLDFCDFLVVFTSFYIIQIDYVEKDFLVLLISLFVNSLQLYLNMSIFKTISIDKFLKLLLTDLYALFVFVGTNNIIFCFIFYFIANIKVFQNKQPGEFKNV